MMKVLEAGQMQACDRTAIEQYRIPGALLMENAGLQVLDVLIELNGGEAPLSTAVICGPGNNGGDGFVVARHLHNLGREAMVYLVADPERLRGDALLNFKIATEFGVPVHRVDAEQIPGLPEIFGRFDFIVDALLGTGIRDAARELPAAVIESMNVASVPIVAIDLPSGLAADSGEVPGAAIEADATVALAALKPCHVLGPATGLCGAINVAEISLPARVVDEALAAFELVTPMDVAAALPRRHAASHKGTHGRVLVVAGAEGTAGAATLTARGALRSGAGLVDIVCPESVYGLVGAAVTEALVHPQSAGPSGGLNVRLEDLAELVAASEVVVVGPGIGTSDSAAKLARDIVAEVPAPVVVDADGLNAIGSELDLVAAAPGIRILTPHPGEAARMLNCASSAIQEDRPAASRTLADRSGAIVILKGYRTLIAAPGKVTVVNSTGNPGMATGGTGDVLAGVVAALVGQGMEPFRAAWVGAFVHGSAGDAVAAKVGELSLMAGDLADALPEAFTALEEIP